MKRLFVLLSIVIACAITAPGSVRAHQSTATKKPFPVTITDDHGNKLRITKQPTRLVTLFPGQTEILFALGLENRVVADGSQYVEGATGVAGSDGKPRPFKYPSEWPSKLGRDYPVKAPQLTHVEGGCCGTPFNVETIESVHPDLIFSPYEKTEEPTYQKIRDLGLKLVILDPANLKGVLQDVLLVGKATGTTKQAQTLVASMNAQLTAIKKRVKPMKSRPRVYYELDATNPTAPYTAGPGTFIDDAIKLVRGSNVADTVTTCSGTLCYPQLSLESLLKLDPQVIVLGDANYGTTPDQVKNRAGWETMAAVKSGRIYPFNDDLISRAGPRILIGVAQLARDVQPKAFRRE